jgi:hypothetical protein
VSGKERATVGGMFNSQVGDDESGLEVLKFKLERGHEWLTATMQCKAEAFEQPPI